MYVGNYVLVNVCLGELLRTVESKEKCCIMQRLITEFKCLDTVLEYGCSRTSSSDTHKNSTTGQTD